MKKIGIITGASSGMGKEFTVQLSECLCTVDELWIIARNEEKLNQFKQMIPGISIRSIPLDLCSQKDLNQLKNILENENPNIRVMVNCAGVGYAGAFLSLEGKEIADMIELNIKALTEVTYLVLPYMHNKSNLIQLASASAFLPQKDFAVYAAAKAYVLSFSKALRAELKTSGIVVTAVCPGPVDTPFLTICNKGKKQKLLKKLTTVQADAVVKQALRDAKKGKAMSVYGLPMKAVYFISHFLK